MSETETVIPTEIVVREAPELPAHLQRGIPIADTGEPWDQQDGESAASYEKFRKWFTMAKAADGAPMPLTQYAEEIGVSYNGLQMLYYRHRWKLRLQAWNHRIEEAERMARCEIASEAMSSQVAIWGHLGEWAAESIMAARARGEHLEPHMAIKALEKVTQFYQLAQGLPTQSLKLDFSGVGDDDLQALLDRIDAESKKALTPGK